MADASQYQEQLIKLTPPGAALPSQNDTTWARLLGALGIELSRIDGRMGQLINEAFPYTTYELLTDWERVTGLPDTCVTEEQTVEQRQRAVALRLSTVGGASAQYFINLAAEIGFTIEVETFVAMTTDTGYVEEPVYSDDWVYVFIIHAPEVTVEYLNVEGAVGERLVTFGNEALECAINRVKPAHMTAVFAYDL
jgi:uncharacterized protein YmfQ (DUF2313 family)